MADLVAVNVDGEDRVRGLGHEHFIEVEADESTGLDDADYDLPCAQGRRQGCGLRG